ncbi:MAG: protein translocase subunit SecD, partial [Thermodesulfobacteriota bacterium]|nr:protein translocase subunit SecD [Thermodesulfobacteriota bacterium]
MKKLSWRLILVLTVIIAAVIYVLPTIKPALWPHKKINLGLDLQGGMHLVLEVETEKAVESTMDRITNELHGALRKDKIRYLNIDRVDGAKIFLKMQGKENIEKFEKLLDKEYKDLRILSKSTDGGVLTIVMDLPDRETEHIKKLATGQALETIRNRIDQFGVSEPDIRLQGDKRILIQLPGIKDTQRAKALIGKTA